MITETDRWVTETDRETVRQKIDKNQQRLMNTMIGTDIDTMSDCGRDGRICDEHRWRSIKYVCLDQQCHGCEHNCEGKDLATSEWNVG